MNIISHWVLFNFTRSPFLHSWFDVVEVGYNLFVQRCFSSFFCHSRWNDDEKRVRDFFWMIKIWESSNPSPRNEWSRFCLTQYALLWFFSRHQVFPSSKNNSNWWTFKDLVLKSHSHLQILTSARMKRIA